MKPHTICVDKNRKEKKDGVVKAQGLWAASQGSPTPQDDTFVCDICHLVHMRLVYI